MNEPDKDEQLAGRAKALFDESVERLDAAALSQLNRRRQAALAALAEMGGTTPAGRWARWVPATGVAAAAVVAVVVWQGNPGGPAAPPAESVTEFEILLGEDSLEMFEDLDFYSWMDTADLDAGSDVG